jgi:hypothetical protein
VTAIIFNRVLGRPEGVAWLAGAFMFAGYITHLTLDEIYSVDVMDTRIKASFGTALKPLDKKHWGHSAAMAAAAGLVFLFTPPTKVFVENISSHTLWSGLHHRLLPEDNKWFAGMAWLVDRAPPTKAETAPQAASPISTGSVASPAPEAAPAALPAPVSAEPGK